MAALLGIATLLAAGMTVLPASASTMEETQGSPCSTTEQGGGDGNTWIECDFEGIGSLEISQAHPCFTTEPGGGDDDIRIDCDFEGIGSLEVGTEGTPPNGPPED